MNAAAGPQSAPVSVPTPVPMPVSTLVPAWPLLLCLVPYLGGLGLYNPVVGLIAVLMLLTAPFGRWHPGVLLAGALFLVSLLVSATLSVALGREINALSFTDVVFLLLWLTTASLLLPDAGRDRALPTTVVACLFVVALCNLAVSLAVRLELLNLAPYVGETDAYDMAYTSVRSVGIIGQPGKMALYCALGIFCCGVCARLAGGKRLKFWAFATALLLLTASFFSLSRTGLALSVLAMLSFGAAFGLLTMAALGTGAWLLLDDATLALLLRATESDSFDVSSFEYRNILRARALEVVFSNPLSLLLGFGPSKEDADLLAMPIPGHTLRYPDSSFTLTIFRYGVLGVVVLLGMVVTIFGALGGRARALRSTPGALLLVLTVVGALLDPLWHEPKVLMVYIFALKLLALQQSPPAGVLQRAC